MTSRAILVLGTALTLLALTTAAAPAASEQSRPRVVLVTEVGCGEAFERIVCGGFQRALRSTGLAGRIVTPAPRQDRVETLELIASQRYDLVTVFGYGYYQVLGEAARRQRAARFALMDAPRGSVAGVPRNVQGVIFRTSEAAYLAGWLAARMAGQRPGKDVVGVVGGLELPSVQDFVVGFRAGARRAGARVLIGYSHDFDDRTKCAAVARRQIAQGAGAVFNVAGACGLGTLAAARKAGVWGSAWTPISPFSARTSLRACSSTTTPGSCRCYGV